MFAYTWLDNGSQQSFFSFTKLKKKISYKLNDLLQLVNQLTKELERLDIHSNKVKNIT